MAATIGTLKGTRTRAVSGLEKEIQGIQANVFAYQQHIKDNTAEQIERLSDTVTSKLDALVAKLLKLETANNNLSDSYANDEVKFNEFQEFLLRGEELIDAANGHISHLRRMLVQVENREQELTGVAPGRQDLEHEMHDLRQQLQQIRVNQPVQAPIQVPPAVPLPVAQVVK